VVQGAKDAAIPAYETQQLVMRLRSVGDEVWYVTARDEAHTFEQPATELAYLQVAAQFLAKWR